RLDVDLVALRQAETASSVLGLLMAEERQSMRLVHRYVSTVIRLRRQGVVPDSIFVRAVPSLYALCTHILGAGRRTPEDLALDVRVGTHPHPHKHHGRPGQASTSSSASPAVDADRVAADLAELLTEMWPVLAGQH
ncbi:hypothetical protein KIPB_007061, partial [Kipferlia bialata]